MNAWRPVTFGLADLGVLIDLRPHLSLVHRIAHPHAWVTHAGTDHVTAGLCAAALWLVAVWVTLGTVAGLTGALPGIAGRVGTGMARTLLPSAMYRIVAGAAGFGVLLTPALAASAPVSHSWPAASEQTPAPQWPTDSPVRPPQWPALPPVAHSGIRGHEHAAQPPQARHGHAAREVTVQSGDTLWGIAADHLPGHPPPRQIAAAWPRWYAANRAVIGDDPGLIVPGQHLHPPSEGSAS